MFRAMTKGSAMVLIDKNLQQYFCLRDFTSIWFKKGILSGGGLNQASLELQWKPFPFFQNVGMAGSINQASNDDTPSHKRSMPLLYQTSMSWLGRWAQLS